MISANQPPAVIDAGITIVNSAGNITDSKVMISSGFISGSDALSWDTTLALANGITGSFNAITGIITFSGSSTAAVWQSLLRTVSISSTSSSTVTRLAIFSIGVAIPNSTNGHFYEFVFSPGISWTSANIAANAKLLYGLQGYLVTISSVEENNLVTSKLQGEGWMGASDNSQEGTWTWVAGPESGTPFFTQTLADTASPNLTSVYGSVVGGGGISVGAEYNNWVPNLEPNDWGVLGENYGHFLNTGEWNDYSVSNSNIQGYVVEYGDMALDPVVTLSANKRIITSDTLPPTGSVSINGGKTATRLISTVLTLPCSDDIACTHVQLSNDNVTWSGWLNYTLGKSWALSAGIDGPRTVYVRYRDAAGNQSGVVSASINLDIVAPSAPIYTGFFGLGNSGFISGSSSRPNFSGTAEPGSIINIKDNGVSIALISAAANGSWSAPGGGASLSEGTHSFTASVTDAAGNTSSATTDFIYTVDLTAPTLTLNGPATITLTQGQSYVDENATAADGVDGDLSSSVTIGGTFTDTGTTGTYTITYDVIDTAGNTPTQLVRTIRIVPSFVPPPINTSPPIQRDTVPPAIHLPSLDLLIPAIDLYGVPADSDIIRSFLQSASATDLISGERPISYDAPNIFPVGKTIVTFTSQDASGNSSSLASTITVSGTRLQGIDLDANIGGDSDGDGLSDSLESSFGWDSNSIDSDADGLSDMLEHILGSNATNSDTDGDGILDADEIGNMNNPADIDGDGSFDVNELPETTNDPTHVTGVASSSRKVIYTLRTSEQPLRGVTVDSPGDQAPETIVEDFGILSFQVETEVGATASVTLTTTAALPSPLIVYKVSAEGLYDLISPEQYQHIDSHSLKITMVDGGELDLDGEANGIVVDPIAFGKVKELPAHVDTEPTPEPIQISVEPTPEPVEMVSGCLINTSANKGSPLLFLLMVALILLISKKGRIWYE
ncbi:MAG: choice-of-anchor U domain-containing protein [Mariprofundaceae bacterium]